MSLPLLSLQLRQWGDTLGDMHFTSRLPHQLHIRLQTYILGGREGGLDAVGVYNVCPLRINGFGCSLLCLYVQLY